MWKHSPGAHGRKSNVRKARSEHFAFDPIILFALPARFSDDHLCPYFMESFPQFSVIQSHPDITLDIGIRASSHGGCRRATEVGLQV